jgi:hypothetical protein
MKRPGDGDPTKAPGTDTQSREATVHGVGEAEAPPPGAGSGATPIVSVVAPARERTVLGVGTPSPAAAPPAAARERSQQEPPPEGWDLPEADPAGGAPVHAAAPIDERSVPIALVAKKKAEPARPSGARAETRDPEAAEEPPATEEAKPPRRRRVGLVLLLLLAAAAAGVYAARDRIPWARARALIGAYTDADVGALVPSRG